MMGHEFPLAPSYRFGHAVVVSMVRLLCDVCRFSSRLCYIIPSFLQAGPRGCGAESTVSLDLDWTPFPLIPWSPSTS